MIEILEKALAEQIKAKQLITISQAEYDSEWTFEVVMTDESYDRHGEVLKADGLDYGNFMKNPVLVADHKYDIDHIIGKVTSIDFDESGKRWIAKGVFSKSNPRAILAKDLYNEGMLKAVSVGLIPQYYEDNDTVKYWELLELSFVAVPANPNAISTEGKGLLQKGIEFGLVVKTNEVIEEVIEDTIIEDVIETIEDETIVIDAGEALQEAEQITLWLILSEIKSLKEEFADYKRAKATVENEADDEEVDLMRQIAGKAARLLQINNQK